MRLRFCSDPGHGWLVVPLELLDRLGLLDRITSYSYIRGGNAYLEEDCDCSTFLAAAKGAGLAVTFQEENCAHRQSRIRNYLIYTPARARENLANGRQWRQPPRLPRLVYSLRTGAIEVRR